jgi:hypothetical protein
LHCRCSEEKGAKRGHGVRACHANFALLELREARDNIDLEVEDTKAVLEAANAFIRQKQIEKQVDVHALGLSNALLKAYADFCESLYSTRNREVIGTSQSCVTSHIIVLTLDLIQSSAFLGS